MKTNVRLYHKLLWVVAVLLSCRPGGETTFAADAKPKAAASPSSGVKVRPPTTGAPAVRVT